MAARTNTKSATFNTKTPAQATKDAQKRAAAKTPKSETYTDEWQTKLVETKLNEQVILEELRARHLDTKGTTFAIAKRLERHVCTNIESGAQVVSCDVCKGRSLSTMRRCPFCGDDSEVVLDQANGETLAPKVEASEPVVVVPPVLAPEPAVAEASDADVFDSDTGTFVPMPPVPMTAIVPVPATEVLPDLRGLQPSVDEAADIVRRVARVRELAVNFVVTGWDLGSELNDIRRGKLWMNLRTDLGAAKYSSFKAFLESECGFGTSWAYNLMTIAELFTREQVLINGLKKHVLLLSVPKDIQQRIANDPELMALPQSTLKDVVREVKGGTSLPTAVSNVANKDIVAPPPREEEEADEPEGDAPTVIDDDAPTPAPKPSPEPAKKPAAPMPTPIPAPKPEPEPPTVGAILGPVPKPQTTVTVVTMPGKFQVKLFAFQKKGALAGKRRAHRVEDLPRGEFVFSPGGQTLRMNVQRSKLGLYLVCEVSPPPTEMK